MASRLKKNWLKLTVEDEEGEEEDSVLTRDLGLEKKYSLPGGTVTQTILPQLFHSLPQPLHTETPRHTLTWQMVSIRSAWKMWESDLDKVC